MAQISKRVNNAHADQNHHIEVLNEIGRRVVSMHDKYLSYMQTNRGKSGIHDPEEQIMATLEILTYTMALRDTQLQLDLLDGTGGKRHRHCQCEKLRKYRIRLQHGLRVYFSHGWEALDWCNYILFITTFTCKMLLRTETGEKLAQIQELNDMADPWGPDAKHLMLYRLSFWVGLMTYLNAGNAILTWIKLFKFLNCPRPPGAVKRP